MGDIHDEIGAAFADMSRAAVGLNDRFDTWGNVGTSAKLALMAEEFNEMAMALRAGDIDHAAHEGVDLITTVVSVLWLSGVDFDRLPAIFRDVAAKNCAKTHDTHRFDAARQKIVRRD